jgi:hypothetical protein
VPVLIINGQDDQNQLLATSYWDVILPLDPHRFLLLPGWRAREEDPQKRVDHLLKLDGGLGQIICQMIFDAADSQVFWHEKHDPSCTCGLRGPGCRRPGSGRRRKAHPGCSSTPPWIRAGPSSGDGSVSTLRHEIHRPRRDSETLRDVGQPGTAPVGTPESPADQDAAHEWHA